MSWAGGLLTQGLFAKDAIARDAGPGGLLLAPTHPVSWLQRRTARAGPCCEGVQPSHQTASERPVLGGATAVAVRCLREKKD